MYFSFYDNIQQQNPETFQMDHKINIMWLKFATLRHQRKSKLPKNYDFGSGSIPQRYK